jgi:hypothetical protein
MTYVVMVRCPNADKAVPTGIVCELSAFSDLAEKPARLQCPECGHVHEWSVTDAWLRDTAYFAHERARTSGTT